MRWLRILRQRFRAATDKNALDAELARELAFHLDQLAAEYEANGLSPADARLAAQRALGNMPLVAEQCRDQRRMTWLYDLGQDLAFGMRLLARNRRVTTVIVASLALGIGANTAVLAVIDAVIREPLPVPSPDRVVVVRMFHETQPRALSNVLAADYLAWRDRQHSFTELGVAFGHQSDFGADAYGPAERIQGQLVTSELFTVLRVPPMLGRVFHQDDVQQGIRPIVLSHRLWQGRFSSDPRIVGRVVRLDDTDAVVVGVMPERLHYPNEGVNFWRPLVLGPADAGMTRRFYHVVGRLRDGVTQAQALADLNRIAAQLEIERPDLHGGWRVHMASVREAMFGWSQQPLLTLGAAVALVLLVACTNVAGLLLARSVARRPEIAMRTALGASRGRLARQLLAESLLLSLTGGLLGLVVAWAGVRALLGLSPPPGGVGIIDTGLTTRVLALSGMLAIGTGLLFGMLPAISGSRATSDPREHGANASPVRPRLREGLVAAQIAITFILLIGAGLLTRTFLQLMTRDVRFDSSNLLTFDLHLPGEEYALRRSVRGGVLYVETEPQAIRKLLQIREAVAALPGVTAVGGISTPLVNSLIRPQIRIVPVTSNLTGLAGSTTPPFVEADYFLVTPQFLTDVRASLRGRDISAADAASSPWVAIVNESAARVLWPDGNAVGQEIRMPDLPDERTRTVIGVVRDIPLNLRHTAPTPVVYTSYLQQPRNVPQGFVGVYGRMHFMVRTSGDPLPMVPAVRNAIATVDTQRPLSGIATMEGRLAGLVPQLGNMVLVLTGFAVTAALLAALGIYGVVAYAAARRTREIGIRIALGASTREIATLVSSRAVGFVSMGLATGMIAALVVTRFLESQLWAVSPTDPVTFAAAVVLLVLVAGAACFVPTRRAVSINPTVALRE